MKSLDCLQDRCQFPQQVVEALQHLSAFLLRLMAALNPNYLR